MSVLGTVGIVIGLVVIALMAFGPALVDLNERHPPRDREPAPLREVTRRGAVAPRSVVARSARLLNHRVPAHH